MPTIPLEAFQGDSVLGTCELWAAMLYPLERDSGKRRQWSAVAKLANLIEAPGGATLCEAREWLDGLWGLEQSPRRTFEDGAKRVPRALVCGALLHLLVILSRHHRHHCKVERAIALLEIEGAKIPLPTSESSAKKAWAEFKSVAHLWAALYPLGEVSPEPRFPIAWNESALDQFLATAEGYREASALISLVDHRKTWGLPKRLQTSPVTVEVAPLSPRLVKFLDGQFPD